MTEPSFPFSVNDVVLADWDGKLYYAKILSINLRKSKCRLLFDDGSAYSVQFSKVHSGKFNYFCAMLKHVFSQDA